MNDQELLRVFAQDQSQDAFRQLVERHLGMVVATAQRMVGDAHLAEEVAQGVFVALAQKAATLGSSVVVGGWLYHTTRHLSMHAVRSEQRRLQREQEAIAMQPGETSDDCGRVLEQLETAMAQLGEEERDALVLRYLEDRTLREVGQELRLSEDAARMRVNRALERLRSAFASQGITVSSAVLASVLTASTTGAMASGLAATITAAALSGSAVATAVTVNTTLTMLNTKVLSAIVGAALLTGTATYYFQQRQVQRWQLENRRLLEQQDRLNAQLETMAQSAKATQENAEQLQKGQAELLRLRDEVSRLRREQAVQKARLTQTPAQAPNRQATGRAPGRYISKEHLSYAGYATPEEALESMAWIMLNGTYEQARDNLGVGGWVKSREVFEAEKQALAPLFKGVQVVARKTLTDNAVELKVRQDFESLPDRSVDFVPFKVYQVVKINDQWRVYLPKDYEAGWDTNGPVEVYSQ